MKKFILLYKGPATPPDATHEGWPEWFKKIGDALVSVGSPMLDGYTVQTGGSTSASRADLNGYSIIQAKDAEAARNLVKDHPYLTFGTDAYCIEIFEIPR